MPAASCLLQAPEEGIALCVQMSKKRLLGRNDVVSNLGASWPSPTGRVGRIDALEPWNAPKWCQQKWSCSKVWANCSWWPSSSLISWWDLGVKDPLGIEGTAFRSPLHPQKGPQEKTLFAILRLVWWGTLCKMLRLGRWNMLLLHSLRINLSLWLLSEPDYLESPAKLDAKVLKMHRKITSNCEEPQILQHQLAHDRRTRQI